MVTARLPDWSAITSFYDHLTLHVVPGPRSISYFLPYILMMIALITSPQRLSHSQIQWLVLPSIYAIQFHVWIHHRSFDVISMNGALMAFMLLGWYDVRRDFRYVKRLPLNKSASPGPATDALKEGSSEMAEIGVNSPIKTISPRLQPEFTLEPYPDLLVQRLTWVAILFASMRMTDWHIGISSHDRKQPGRVTPLSDFILHTISQGVFAYVLLDFTSPYIMATVCESNATVMTGQYFQAQIVRSLILLIYLYAALSLFTALLPHLISVFALLAVPSLRLNSLASPLTWPDHFGPLSSIYSRQDLQSSQNLGLRAFWGIFWHQNMRFITSTPGVALASVLNLNRGSKIRYFVIIISSFFWSGVVHMGVVPPEPEGTRSGCWKLRLQVASFFWLQTAGIIVEDMISGVIGSSDALDEKARTCEVGTLSTASGSAIQQFSKRSKIAEVFTKSGILMWTIGFLAFTAWWTVLPVACEMGWLNPSLAPVSLVGRLKSMGL